MLLCRRCATHGLARNRCALLPGQPPTPCCDARAHQHDDCQQRQPRAACRAFKKLRDTRGRIFEPAADRSKQLQLRAEIIIDDPLGPLKFQRIKKSP